MNPEKALINRVEKSGLVTIDLEIFYPKENLTIFDIKNFLVKELVLMEKPFRESLARVNWEEYKGKIVGIFCSTDALVPLWAYMLITSYLEPHAKRIIQGNKSEVETVLLKEAIEKINPDEYKDAKVVIKGCGKISIPAAAYVAITAKLKPVVQTLMFGEPCSTVPVYKRIK